MSLHTIRHSLRRLFSDRTLIDELAIGCIAVLLLVFWYQVTPSFTDVRYKLSQSEEVHEQRDSMFFSFESIDNDMRVTFLVRQGFSLRPSRFIVRADDCLSGLIINGQTVPQDVIGPCVIDTPVEMHLGPYFREGINDVEAIVPDTGGRQGFSIRTSPTDPLLLCVRLALLLVLTLLALHIIRCRFKSREVRWVALLFLLGVLLRLLYFDVTPYDIRSNDADGHMEYIQHVSNRWTIPKTGDGWEYYQPPLYYFLSAPFYSASSALNLSYFSVTKIIQFLGTLFSVGILALCVWIGAFLFQKHRIGDRCLWIALLAVFPGMVLLSAKVNNDVLAQFLSFVAVAATLEFWKSGRTQSWIIIILAIAFGMLSKMNVILLLPVAFLTLFFHSALRFRSKMLLGVIGLLIVLGLTEWLVVLRHVQDSGTSMVGNFGNLNSGLQLSNRTVDYFTFNPWQVLRHPFNDPWDDVARRTFFLEYLFRSSFFGEFNFGSSLRFFSQMLLALAFPVGLLALFGAVFKAREHYRQAFPLWLTFFFILIGHGCFRFFYPYSSSEDFRYSLLLVLPVTYFALIAIPHSGHLRMIIVNLLWSFALLSTVFIVTLCILNPV